jgi:hypothetical protein
MNGHPPSIIFQIKTASVCPASLKTPQHSGLYDRQPGMPNLALDLLFYRITTAERRGAEAIAPWKRLIYAKP